MHGADHLDSASVSLVSRQALRLLAHLDPEPQVLVRERPAVELAWITCSPGSLVPLLEVGC